MRNRHITIGLVGIGVGAALVLAPQAQAAPAVQRVAPGAVAASWTQEAMARAIPRDIVKADNGRWYMTTADGRLRPYGIGATGSTIEAKGKPSSGGGTISNARWTGGGTVQTAAGRLYFRMLEQGTIVGYVCSGTVVQDELANYSAILTAAHCVYDDVNKAFAFDVMFIPDQVASGTRTDRDCSNDLYGCWMATKGAIDVSWKAGTWPENIPYDYGIYLVPTTGAHAGTPTTSSSLEATVGALPISWTSPTAGGAYTYALGYSYKFDPSFMYCAQTLATVAFSSTYANWWLGKCALSGGASGGPWMQPTSGTTLTGDEPVLSVNSWGYNGRPGMAGPRLQTGYWPRAKQVYDVANGGAPNGVGLLADLSSANA